MEIMFKMSEKCASSSLTCDYPVSLWLALVSMDTHGRPTKKQNDGGMGGLGNTLNSVLKYSPKSSGQYSFLTRHASSSGSGRHNASWSPQRWWFCSLSQPWSPPSAGWVWPRRESSNNTSEVQNSEDSNRFCYNAAATKCFLTSRPFPFPGRRQQFAECCGWHWAPEHQH